MAEGDGKSSPEDGRGGSWSRLLPIGALILGALALLFLLPFGSAILSDVHKRNQSDLGIAASGLESWSDAIQAVAIGSFIRGRVSGLSEADRDYRDGWRMRASLRHPSLREYRVVYATGDAALCDTIGEAVSKAEGGLPFVRSYQPGGGGMLKVTGKFPVAEIYARDQRAGLEGADVAGYLNDVESAAAPPADVAADALQVCYGAVIPVEGLLQTRENGQGFTSLLVVSPEGGVLTQIGSERLPLSSIEALKPESGAGTGDVAASLARAAAKAGGVEGEALSELPEAKSPPSKLIETLDPVELSVGGRSYYAYARPFFPPAEGFQDCRPADMQKEPVAAGERGHCYVVGLMPKAQVWRQLASPPLVLTIGLALVIGMVLVLLPAVRLILLGPGEAIGRLEMAALALGLPAAASLATLFVLVLTDVSAHRASADARAGRIAEQAAIRAAGEIEARVEAAAARARGLAALERDSMGGSVMNTAEGQLIAVMTASAGAAPFEPLQPPSNQPLPAPFVQNCLHAALAGEWKQPPGKWSDGQLPPGYVTSGMLLEADPRPLRCTEAPLCRETADSESGLPLLELSGLVDAPGRRLAGLRAVSCRAFPGGRTELAGRDYFRRLTNGDPGQADGRSQQGFAYTIAQVMALQDGIPQTVIALRAPAPAWHPGRAEAFLVSTTSLPSLIRPILPPPFQLMVVDTRDPALRVIIHREAGRAGAERLDEMLDGSDALRRLLRSATEKPGAALSFQRFYDGAERHFAAAGISGTPWVVLVHHDRDMADSMPVQTGWRALITWASMSILFGVAWLVWLMLVGQRGVQPKTRLGEILTLGGRGWPRLWPQEGHSLVYNRLSKLLFLAALVAGLAIALAGGGAAVASATAAGVFIALGLRAGAGLWLHQALRMAPDKVKILRPETQARFVRLAVALIVCLSVVPMLAFWLDARALTAQQERLVIATHVSGQGGLQAESSRAYADLRWVLGLDRLAPEAGTPRPFGMVVSPDAKPLAAADAGQGFAGTLLELQRGNGIAPVAGCANVTGNSEPILCGPALSAVGWIPPAIWQTRVEPQILILLAALAVGLAAMMWMLLNRTLTALCGFGVALEAVTYPNLFLGNLWGKKPPAVAVQTLNRKSLLVNAPWTIVPMLQRMGGPAGEKADRRLVGFDLSGLDAAEGAPLPAIEVKAGDIIELFGLELVLADPARRLMALRAVEELVRQVDQMEQENDLTDPFLLFFAPTAPMDRILDAYEREGSADLIDGTRENLRWARLFEDFATFHFRPIDTTDGFVPDSAIASRQAEWDALGDHEREAIQAVYSELRWLSPRVVNGCINEEVMPPAALLDTGVLPLGTDRDPPTFPYPEIYGKRLMDWALLRQFAGREATLAYLRAQFIEHYQRLWSGSTRAERLVLHHLAQGRFVNIASGLAFASLLRRGVVVLDPEPRLVNESFAMFVRQAEKLDRIVEWQKDMPTGAWVRAQLPILLTVAVAGLLLVGLLVAGDQQPAKLLPVLAAGLPALLAAMHRMMQSN